jgi:hypothetical protein
MALVAFLAVKNKTIKSTKAITPHRAISLIATPPSEDSIYKKYPSEDPSLSYL